MPGYTGGGGVRNRHEMERRRLHEERRRAIRDRPEAPEEPPEYDHDAPPETLGTMAPVQGNPSMDPAGSMMTPARMTGWSPGFGDWDALEGVGEMATPGGPDATRELDVDSATDGGPLELAHDESVYDDQLGAGTHTLAMSETEDPARFDWCESLRADDRDSGWL